MKARELMEHEFGPCPVCGNNNNGVAGVNANRSGIGVQEN